MISINKQQRELFAKLSARPHHTFKCQSLAESMGLGVRSIQNHCAALESLIAEMGLPEILTHTTSSIVYSGTIEQTSMIWDYIGGETFYEYHLAPDERMIALVLTFLSRDEPVTVQSLCDLLFVSRSTLLSDLGKVKLYFDQFHIDFLLSGKRGYLLHTDEMQRQNTICTTCFPRLGEWDTINIGTGIVHFLSQRILGLTHIIPEASNIVERIERSYGISVNDQSFKEAVFTLSVLCSRLEQGKRLSLESISDRNMLHLSVGKIAEMMLREMSTVFDIPYGEGEIAYLAWQLHQCHFDILHNFEHSIDFYFYIETCYFLSTVEKEMHQQFSNLGHVATILTRHMYRLYREVRSSDAVNIDELIDSYPECYRVVKENIYIIEQSIGRSCTQPELHSVFLYVVTELIRQNEHLPKPQVVVLCHVGVGTANYLASQLIETFNLNVVKVASVHNISEVLQERNFDFIVSTVPLKLEDVRCIIVSPNLEDLDIILIQRAIIEVNRTKRLTSAGRKSKTVGLSDLCLLLREDHVILDRTCTSWEEAIDIAAEPLLASEEILPQYVEAIKENTRKNGPYFVFSPGVALPHAAPADGALRFCCSILRLRDPIPFGHKSNDPVKLIVMIGVTDVDTQIPYVSSLMYLLTQEPVRNQILSAKTERSVLQIMTNYSQ